MCTNRELLLISKKQLSFYSYAYSYLFDSLNLKCFASKYRSTLTNESNIELHSTFNNFNTDMFVISMNTGTLIGSKIGGRKAVNMVGYPPVVSAVGAGDH